MTEEKIRKYFLGELSTTEAENFEEMLIFDSILFSQAEIVENEIIDDYLQKRLSSSEHLSFEQKYLTTDARHKKVKSAENFFQVLQETPSEVIGDGAKKNFGNLILAGFSFPKVFVYGVGAVAIILVAVILSFIINRQNNQDIVSQPNTNQSSKTSNENKVDVNDANLDANLENVSNVKPVKSPNKSINPTIPAPSPETKPSPQIKNEEKANPVFAFTLLPGGLRSAGEQTIKISPQSNKIILRLTLPENAVKYQSYKATIKTVEGNIVFTSSNLTSLNPTVPADKFRNETYIVFLEGITSSKTAESIAEYTFRANR